MSKVTHGKEVKDQLNARANQTQVYGLAGNDTLTSTGKSDVLLIGGSGDDSLVMLGGNGTLSGGKGADTFELTYSTTNPISAVIEDLEPGIDKIVVNFEGNTAPQLSSLASGDDVVWQDNGGLFNLTLKSVRENDYFDGTASEQAWEVLELTNKERELSGLSPLTMSEGLMIGANIRAGEITALGESGALEDHTRPDGTNFSTVLNNKYSTFGENLDAGANSPSGVINDWMNSPHHRANILDEENKNFQKLGVGYNDRKDSELEYYWVQLFAEGLNNPETVSTAELLTANIESSTVPTKFITLKETPDTYNNKVYGATIAALGGNDKITNAELIVSVSGGAGADTIETSGAFATINAGKDNDFVKLSSDAKENLIQYASGDGSDTIEGFSDTDTLSIIGDVEYTPPITVGNDVIVSVGTDSITLADAATLKAINIEGGKQSNLFIGTEDKDNFNNTIDSATIQALGGNDVIDNEGASVSIDGGAGRDKISNSGADSTILGGDDNDTIENYADAVILDGGAGADKIDNEGANVTITGGDGNDNITNEDTGTGVTINAGAGADKVTNEGASSMIDSGEGNDYISNNAIKVTISSGDGDDTINNKIGSDDVSIASGTGNDVIDNKGSNVTIIADGGNNKITNAGASSTILSGDGSDTITNDNKAVKVSIASGAGDDKITNEGENVTIRADEGNDIITNKGANSTIFGDDGADTIENSNKGEKVSIIGGNGNDSIKNSGADSTVLGGDGSDTITNDNKAVKVSIIGGEGDDKITNKGADVTISGGLGDDTISLSGSKAKNNVIEYTAGDGNDVIKGFNETATLSIAGASYSSMTSGKNVIFTVGDGKITLEGVADSENLNVVGEENTAQPTTTPPDTTPPDTTPPDIVFSQIISLTSDNDTYSNNSDSVAILALGGDDYIYNNRSSVSIDGGAGDDTVRNNASEVTIAGDAGNDYIYNNYSSVSIDGGAGDDTVYSWGSEVTISGGTGDDSIFLGDYCPNNLIVYNGGDGNDLIQRFRSTTTLQIGGGSGTYSTQTSGYDVLINVDDSTITLKNAYAKADILHINDDEIELERKVISLTADNERIYIDRDSISVNTGAGDDTVDNYASQVTIAGGAGDDSIYNYYGNNVSIDAGEGDDTIDNHASEVTIDAGEGNDRINNSGSNVTVMGGAGDDTVYSNDREVTISGGTGDDSVFLGDYASDNLIVYNGGDGNDLIQRFRSTTTLQIGGGSGTYSTQISGYDVLINVDDSTITLKNAYATADILHINDDEIELERKVISLTADREEIYIDRDSISVNTGAGDDTVENYASQVTIDAGEGNDDISNFYSSVSIDGGAGDDTIDNHASEVTIAGDAGDDTVWNYASTVSIDAGEGADYIVNSSSSVSIDGGAGDDTVYSNDREVTISGGTGDDSISLGTDASNNLIVYNSSDGNDTITGFDETSTLSIAGASYSSVASGDDVIITVGDGSISLVGAATLDNINIVALSMPEDAEEYNGHYYYLFDEGLTWQEAKAYCEARGGYLVTITDLDEQNFVQGLVEENGTKNSYWMGGYKNDSGDWQWITDEAWDYTNWSYRQPDGDGSVLMMYRGDNYYSEFGQWNDFNESGVNGQTFFGTENFGFICEWGTPAQTVNPKLITLTEDDDDTVIAVEDATVHALAGDDTITNDGDNAIIYLDEGDDEITNNASNVSISGGADDDSIENRGVKASITGDDGNDSIHNNRGRNASIYGGAGSDTISNSGLSVTIDGGLGDDSIFSNANFVSIAGGGGDDKISLSSSSRNNLVRYTEGDGNDTIWGLSENSTLNILPDEVSVSSLISGNDLIYNVGEGSIKLVNGKNKRPHIIIGESGSSGGNSGGNGSGGGQSGGGSGDGGSGGNSGSGGSGGNGGGGSSGGTSNSGNNSGASGGNSASGSSGSGTSSGMSGGNGDGRGNNIDRTSSAKVIDGGAAQGIVIDRRGVEEFEIINGTAGMDTIYAGDGGAQMWGGSDTVTDILIGGSGSDIFIGGKSQGSESIRNASTKDTIRLDDVTLSDIVSAKDTNGFISLTLNTGSTINIQSAELLSAAIQLADGSSHRFNHMTRTWQKG